MGMKDDRMEDFFFYCCNFVSDLIFSVVSVHLPVLFCCEAGTSLSLLFSFSLTVLFCCGAVTSLSLSCFEAGTCCEAGTSLSLSFSF